MSIPSSAPILTSGPCGLSDAHCDLAQTLYPTGTPGLTNTQRARDLQQDRADREGQSVDEVLQQIGGRLPAGAHRRAAGARHRHGIPGLQALLLHIRQLPSTWTVASAGQLPDDGEITAADH